MNYSSQGARLRYFSWRPVLLVALALTPAFLGCDGADEDAQIEIEEDIAEVSSALISRIQGSTIQSPNVKAGSTYLSARWIQPLEMVGALDGALGKLARRVDGIIANKPADGRFSVQEILQIEKPKFIKTLFPDEKAALPALWALLETTNDAPLGVPAHAPFSFSDASAPIGAPLKPAFITVASLPDWGKTYAERLELSYDSDGDPSTITEADLDAAIADPEPYTEQDIALFKVLKQEFIIRAGTTLSAKLSVTAPYTDTTTFTFGPATLKVTQAITYLEKRIAPVRTPPLKGFISTELKAQITSRGDLVLPTGTQLLVLQEASGDEYSAAFEQKTLNLPQGGDATVELWSGGARQGTWRVTLPELREKDQKVDLSAYVDYALFSNGASGGAPLVRNVLSATQAKGNDPYYGDGSTELIYSEAAFQWDAVAKPAASGISADALSAVATPKLAILPGRYAMHVFSVTAMQNCMLDIYPEGVMKLTRADGTSVRSSLIVEGTKKFEFAFPDETRAVLDSEQIYYFKVYLKPGQGYYDDSSLLQPSDRIQ